MATTPNIDPKTEALSSTLAEQKLIRKVREMLLETETDVNRRNTYINERYSLMYNNGIMQRVNIRSGNDRTAYNFLPTVVDIHSKQISGRLPQIVTSFEKEDLSIYTLGVDTSNQDAKTKADVEKTKAQIRNARKAADADVRNDAIRNIMDDNKFDEIVARGAEIGGWSGITVVKGWLDRPGKKYKFSLIEQPQNFARHWSSSDFRDHDADFFSYQVGKSQAMRDWGKLLKPGEEFTYNTPNVPWQRADESLDLEREQLPFVWVIDCTGFFPGFGIQNGKVSEVPVGTEKAMSLLIVGNKVINATDKDLPEYYVINNREIAGSPWGRSDIPEELIQINATMIETMSDWRTASWKVTFPKLKFLGFDALNMLTPDDRQSQGFPLAEGQDIAPIHMENTLAEFPRLLTSLWDSFTKVAGVSRVMLDDPTLNIVSAQAMMAGMKALVNVTEDKQKRWGNTFREMFTDALNSSATLELPALKEAVQQQEWSVNAKWPSVQRTDDPAYRQMIMNEWTQGLLSPESFYEKTGQDWTEELARIEDAMEDPLRAAMMSRSLGNIAMHAYYKSAGIPPWGYVVPKVQIRGDMSPEEMGNLAHEYGWDQGPYGAAIGPQGNQGLTADDTLMNQGLINNQSPTTPMAQPMTPGQQQQAPQLTTDQNTGGGQVSTAGSGQATPVSAQGAINMHNQRAGR